MNRIIGAMALAATMLLAGCNVIQSIFAPKPADPDGPYLLLEIDANSLMSERLDTLSEEMATRLRSASPIIRYNARVADAEAARIRLVDPSELARARQALAPLAQTIDFIEHEDGLIEARLKPATSRMLINRAMLDATNVIRRRLDPLRRGAAIIHPRGPERLVVRANNLDPVRPLVGPVGLLTFHLVREVDPGDAMDGDLPAGAVMAPPYPGIGDRAEVVDRRPRTTGAHVSAAHMSADPNGAISVALQFDAEGARQFCAITRQYNGQRFAILLDGQVVTAPTINEPICGGSALISGHFTRQTARDLATILSAGALPTPFRVIGEGQGAIVD